jgi:endonuclease/exonuclease/phosphatase family metal-dependent hydrolase
MTLQKTLLVVFTALVTSACSTTNVDVKQQALNNVLSNSASDTANKPMAKQALYRAGWKKPANFEGTNNDRIKIISWNVEHFVDLHNDPYVDNRREDNAQHMGSKRADLLLALRQANADIVVLQEFESAKLLREMAATDLSDMGYQFFADAPSHTWYMNVVIMSRVPLGVMYNYGNVHTELVNWLGDDGKPATQSRLNTRTWAIEVFPTEDYSFVLGAVHLKAGRGDRDIAMRLGQINMLKAQFERFLNEDSKRNILLVGDFNALPKTQELNTLLRGTNPGNTFVDPLSDNDFTHPAIAPERRLDYAVMNQNMFAEMVPNSAKPVAYFEPKRQDDLADHLPVVIEFFLRD